MLAPDAIRQKSKEHTADPRCQQGERPERSRDGLAHPQIAHQHRQHERVQHRVEGIERPAHRRGEQRPPLRRGRLTNQLDGANRHRVRSRGDCTGIIVDC